MLAAAAIIAVEIGPRAISDTFLEARHLPRNPHTFLRIGGGDLVASNSMFQQTDTIDNHRECELQVQFEPWGMSHRLPAGRAFTVVTTADVEGKRKMVRSDQTVTVYAFPTATQKIYLGEELIDKFDVKVPELPQQMTMRNFTKSMFGNAAG